MIWISLKVPEDSVKMNNIHTAPRAKKRPIQGFLKSPYITLVPNMGINDLEKINYKPELFIFSIV